MSINLKDIKKRQILKEESEKSQIEDSKSTDDNCDTIKSSDEPKIYSFDMQDSVIDDLDQYMIPNTSTVYYIPNYISQKDHDIILNSLIYEDKEGWNELTSRSVKKYGGDVTSVGLENKQELPSYLQPLAQKVYDDFIVSMMPNHMLINAYGPGDGIMPHTDGPAYHPEVA